MERSMLVKWLMLLSCICLAFPATGLAADAKPVVQARGECENGGDYEQQTQNNAEEQFDRGKEVFRFDTFGSEEFWGGQLRLHETLSVLPPSAALQLGLKVDAEALPGDFIDQLEQGMVDLDDPAGTLLLLKQDAVVGVKGFFEGDNLVSVGINCSLCHSTVDDSLAPGVGRRLDGWANRDLDVGKVIASAPTLQPFAEVLGVSEAAVEQVLTSWGPGKFDAILVLDGKGFRPDGGSASVLIPPAYGLAGFNLATWTGWGTVTYWNAFVANLEMRGMGTFFDERLTDAEKFPIAAENGFNDIRNTPDLITPKLADLHFYQLALPAPEPPAGSFDTAAAERGEELFSGKAECARCHVPPLYTEPGWNLHSPDDIGIDDFQASRSPTERYRTAPLKGLWAHVDGGFFHDGRFATLLDVINHYNTNMDLGLTEAEKMDLEQYLLSL
ncbi:hypothetical protein PCS_01161 [Desulfocurvibacter africanus PCS]|uniref:Cytochrome c domain-containing protein n=1 Tax=Desulfocurvibacter africanus PCS TaxID=1262666 RepID=M5PUI4_DESAF|nr:hypothetical protein [Desulfocurvibacter africanus]EMG37992.1 hypothetical protein PCS_01161 [Desulfocurvibacter africanus PCS]